MKISYRFFTIVPVLALAGALAACGGGPKKLSGQEQMTAEMGARQTAERMQAEYVTCSGQDSDRDGYVTCNIRGRQPPHAESELLCSYGAVGCKRK